MVVRLIRALVHIIALLPLRAARGLGAAIGWLAWAVKSRGAITTLTNLKACYPDMSDRELRRLAGRSMRHWGMTLCEIPVVWRRGGDSLAWVTDVHGADVAERIAQRDRGVMIVSPHLGNWELMGYWGGSQGPITTLYQPPRRFDLDDLLVDARRKTGATLVPTNVRGVGQLIKALKKHELVGILPDMEPDMGSGEFAPFFGVPALTMTLIHSLHQRSGAMIVLCFARRVRGGFELVLLEPDEDIYSEDPVASVAALNHTIEKLVAMAPEQYQWEYKRFKRRPDGYPKLYS